MRYRINVHRADGVTMRDEYVEAETYEQAQRTGGQVLRDHEVDQGYRVTADALPSTTGPCPRCGDATRACGGPMNPHE